MAGNEELPQPPHGGSKTLKKYNAAIYGPLVDYEPNEKHYNNFRGGSYLLTTTTENGMKLYRMYGGKAGRLGQYWLHERREGSAASRMDSALLKEWGNDLTEQVEIYVPSGIVLIEGYAAPQKSPSFELIGGGWQVFIPSLVAEHLLRAKDAVADHDPSCARMHIEEAFKAQKAIMDQYHQRLHDRNIEILQEFCSERNGLRLLQSGNALRQLSPEVRRALESKEAKVSTSTGSSMPCDTAYLVHSETLTLADGSPAPVSLHVRLEYSHQTTRTYQSGNTIITEITKYYKRIFEWK